MLRHASAYVVASDHDRPLCLSASRKRSSQTERRGTEVSLTVSSPPERPKQGKSTATGRRLAAAMPSKQDSDTCHEGGVLLLE
jgi:hypothetical protein